MALDGQFHQHLDEGCEQCKNQPFNLCSKGSIYIQAEAHNKFAFLCGGCNKWFFKDFFPPKTITGFVCTPECLVIKLQKDLKV